MLPDKRNQSPALKNKTERRTGEPYISSHNILYESGCLKLVTCH